MSIHRPLGNGTFAARLSTARLVAGLTREDLGVRVGVPAEVIEGWELERGEPAGTVRRELAVALRVPYHLLYVPEDVAERLSGDAVALLRTARAVRHGGQHLYVTPELPAERAAAHELAQLWLVDHAGPRGATGNHHHVTGPGEDVLTVIRAGL